MSFGISSLRNICIELPKKVSPMERKELEKTTNNDTLAMEKGIWEDS